MPSCTAQFELSENRLAYHNRNSHSSLTRRVNKDRRYWRACNYLSAGMIYLRDNPLLREPLKPEHIKKRLLGHWGSDPGQRFLGAPEPAHQEATI